MHDNLFITHPPRNVPLVKKRIRDLEPGDLIFMEGRICKVKSNSLSDRLTDRRGTRTIKVTAIKFSSGKVEQLSLSCFGETEVEIATPTDWMHAENGAGIL